MDNLPNDEKIRDLAKQAHVVKISHRREVTPHTILADLREIIKRFRQPSDKAPSKPK